jgi:hypothetical protein
MSQDLSSVPGVPQDALIFIDSVESKNGMEGLDPTKIALINIVKGKKLKEKYGPAGENGVIFIETVAFARKRYTLMFAELSAAYKKQLVKAGSDSSFTYLLNGEPVQSNREQMLAAVERKDIAKVTVIADGKVDGKDPAPGSELTKLPTVIITMKTN